MTPAGRLRLDAIARYLQDVAEDDLLDSGLRDAAAWLLTAIHSPGQADVWLTEGGRLLAAARLACAQAQR